MDYFKIEREIYGGVMRRGKLTFAAVLTVLVALAPAELTTAAAAPMQLAQATQPSPAGQPGRVQKLRERTKESWSQMKRRWSTQREKYSACRKEARAKRLVGSKTRQFLEDCMGR
jgi:hypothetical protein